MKTQIKISEILELIKRKREINSLPLSDIEFLDENNEPIVIDEKIISDFTFTGLSNIDFIKSGFYQTGWQEEKE